MPVYCDSANQYTIDLSLFLKLLWIGKLKLPESQGHPWPVLR